MDPYYADDTVTLYCGDAREILLQLGRCADAIVTDPPYGETSLPWDRWPSGWVNLAGGALRPGGSLWSFGSMRMFLDRRDEFDGWKLAQDVVWEKEQGSGFAADRFRRVHEHALHWYRGAWSEVYKDPQREPGGHPAGSTQFRAAQGAKTSGGHTGELRAAHATADGMRLVRSIIRATSGRGRALHPTEKPAEILRPLVRYSCPPGGTVLDCFAGSGSTLAVARETGRKTIGIEADEKFCRVIVDRLAQSVLAV